MDEYQVTGIICGVVFASWLAAFVIFEIWSHVWAWIDESKSEGNFIIKLFKSKSKWKYPVYYSCIDDLMGYAKDKKFDGVKDSALEKDVDYISKYKKAEKEASVISRCVIITSILPFAILIGFKIYPVTVAVATLIIIAHLSRFTRRLSKKYKYHASDKSIHAKVT